SRRRPGPASGAAARAIGNEGSRPPRLSRPGPRPRAAPAPPPGGRFSPAGSGAALLGLDGVSYRVRPAPEASAYHASTPYSNGDSQARNAGWARSLSDSTTASAGHP